MKQGRIFSVNTLSVVVVAAAVIIIIIIIIIRKSCYYVTTTVVTSLPLSRICFANKYGRYYGRWKDGGASMVAPSGE